jgi:hypothetical protein
VSNESVKKSTWLVLLMGLFLSCTSEAAEEHKPLAGTKLVKVGLAGEIQFELEIDERLLVSPPLSNGSLLIQYMPTATGIRLVDYSELGRRQDTANRIMVLAYSDERRWRERRDAAGNSEALYGGIAAGPTCKPIGGCSAIWRDRPIAVRMYFSALSHPTQEELRNRMDAVVRTVDSMVRFAGKK